MAPVPPPESTQTLNFPPEYDLTSVFPSEGRLDVNPDDCQLFEVEVGAIWDKDGDDLLFRWVANNERPNTRIVRRTQVSSADPGVARSSSTRVSPGFDFANELALAREPGGTGVGVLSLFVTDASAWLTPDDEAANPDQEKLDLGQIAADGDPTGPSSRSVVEARWSVVISDSLEGCPQ